MKKVCWNGRNDDFWGNSAEAELLTKGIEYEVLSETDYGFHTTLELKGLEGLEFNSVWFEEAPSSRTYLGIVPQKPVVGLKMHCVFRINELGRLDGPWTTSTVVSVKEGDGVYTIKTVSGSTYILQVR